MTTALLILWALLTAGCVTEGALVSGPESDEEAAQAYLELGSGYLERGQPAAAVDALNRALEYRPRLADAHTVIALAYDQLQETELAEDHHRRATQLSPTNPIPQNAFAVFLCRQDRWDEAQPYFRRAIDNARAINPRGWMFNAATCARSAGDSEGEENFYREVLAMNPADVSALRNMIDLSIREQDYWQGRGFWQRLEQSTPVESVDLLSCYIIESGLGDGGAASVCAARLEDEFPESPASMQLRRLMTANGG
jgi:type IV pilus assembly protein PilF